MAYGIEQQRKYGKIRRFYLYGKYEQYGKALAIAQRKRKIYNSRYQIMPKYENGQKIYELYLTNIIKTY